MENSEEKLELLKKLNEDSRIKKYNISCEKSPNTEL
jgi:hypothetical protein